VEGVDVPQARVVALVQDLEPLLVRGRNHRAAGLALVEELVLGHLGGGGVVGHEHQLDFRIAAAHELIQQEKERPRQVFLGAVHRP